MDTLTIAHGMDFRGINGGWIECNACFAQRRNHDDYHTRIELTAQDCLPSKGQAQCDACGATLFHPVEVGEFIRIPAWQTEGMVIKTQPARLFGSEDAIEVLLKVRIDDPNPRWYRLEPNEYEVL